MPIILRDALRGIRTGRGTTVLAFLIFAVAVAAGTVTFSVVDTIALRPMPFESPERLVAVGLLSPNGSAGEAAPQDYVAWSNRIGAFSAMGAYRLNAVLTLDAAGDGRELLVARVTSGLFRSLRARPALGRLFGPEHDEAGRDTVVVLGHALWTSAFGADPGIVGRTIALGGVPRVVIGVLEPDVTYPVGREYESDAYIPMTLTPDERLDATPRRSYDVQVIARLRDDATVDEAQEEIDAVNAGRGRRPAGANPRSHLVVPLIDQVVGPARAWLLFALVGVACVVLVACVNVAGLLLARATVRARELATREMLGASRRRLVTTLVAEGLMLSAAAGAAGVVVSVVGIDVVTAFLPEGLARASAISLDGRVLLTAIGTIVLCGLAFSSAPAWMVSRADLLGATRSGSAAVIGGRGQARSLGVFLVAETAFVSALLVATVLVVSTFILVTTADLGYDRRNLMVFGVQMDLGDVARSDRASVAATVRAEILRRVNEVPGVASAALIRSGVPFSGEWTSYPVGLAAGRTVSVGTREVTPQYFHTMDLRLVAGRALVDQDGIGAPRVVVINDVYAERFSPGSNPIGQAITVDGPATIVGVVRGVRAFGPEYPLEPELYISMNQVPVSREDAFQVVVRPNGPAAAVADAAREAVRAAIGVGEVFEPRLFDDIFWRMTAERRFNAGVMTAFGLVAIVIGALGIYGTMAFVVARNVRAIGLRMALGATPGQVRASVLREALGRVATGLVLGLVGAWTMSGMFVALVFRVEPTSPAVYAAVAALMAAVAFAAALVPAVRAARLDPLVALRTE